jgi:hypothetical protein
MAYYRRRFRRPSFRRFRRFGGYIRGRFRRRHRRRSSGSRRIALQLGRWKLTDVLITDNHTDLTALYTLLYGCCSQAHSDSAALLSALNTFSSRNHSDLQVLLSALNSFSGQAHSDAQSVLSSLAGLQGALASINDALVSGFSGMESSLAAVAENTAAVASNTKRPAFSLGVWPAEVELVTGNALTLSYHFSGAVATVIVSAMLDDSVMLPVDESAQTVWCPPFDTPGSFEVFVRATDGLSEALIKSHVTVTESVPDITASFNISPGSGTAPSPVSGPSPAVPVFPARVMTSSDGLLRPPVRKFICPAPRLPFMSIRFFMQPGRAVFRLRLRSRWNALLNGILS